MCQNCIVEGNTEEKYNFRGKTTLLPENIAELIGLPEGLRIVDMWTEINHDVQMTTLKILVESDEPMMIDGVRVTEKTSEYAYPISFSGSVLRRKNNEIK